MPYDPLATTAQNDLLGPHRLQQYSDNLAWLRWIAAREHLVSTGEHNAIEVPRVCRRISGTTVSPSSSIITSVTHPSTGRYVINLSGTYFTVANAIRVQVNGAGDGTKPFLASWQVMSATQIEVYFQKLSTALGAAGNAWAAANTDFDIAIHHDPIAQTAWNALPVLWSRADYMTDRATGWNTLIQESANEHAVLVGAHSTAGAHNVREVAKYSGRVYYDTGSADYKVTGTLSSAAKTGTWVVEITHTSLTTPVGVFVAPDYQRVSGVGDPGDIIVINSSPKGGSEATVAVAYIFKCDTSNVWNVANADMYVAVHGDP